MDNNNSKDGDIVTIFSFDIDVLNKPRDCIWKSDINSKEVCPNPVKYIVIRSHDHEKDERGIVEMGIAMYCVVHYSDTFPELAAQDGIFI